ncbi:septum site-determining protein MinC [Photobacterium leiognathi]|uniref:Probable septum site-determining protein MinC n=2 Tax=Photobacterium leiognathi TaxID=553611 RepID=A0ABX5GAS5_PHOLE|nr:septum site-determining protein MinC [Photobacterium leiognathi]KJF86294.1 septum formation inhibitor [Photobacterium leiognathi]PSV03521.1 septum site-determining protein MinC [Photobacterium leiognathi subsp. mandapamensis]PSV13741.1 septum site-determining protein MinC [Photobacterium leiognathi subsp. mandapamensis]PSV77320.1 septum site-determining protein MinC [Photobacterium leiognathi]PSW45518.1 septum site-determining protein MinC [Photobacterium leiognathi subsp. mandapamensis]
MTKTAELKGSSFTLSALHLIDGDIKKATDHLKEKVELAPNFFASAPVVIDISNAGKDINFKQLKAGIVDAGMIPVGISGCKEPELQKQAKSAGFAIMNAARSVKEQSTAESTEVEPSPQPEEKGRESALIIRTPVRSGQQIYAKNRDLVILNHVSAGAEILADGCIHIYGTLRGRAIAGANGDQEATIFCQNLQSELISVAGNYWLSDNIQEEFWGKGVVISIANNTLSIEHLAL